MSLDLTSLDPIVYEPFMRFGSVDGRLQAILTSLALLSFSYANLFLLYIFTVLKLDPPPGS